MKLLGPKQSLYMSPKSFMYSKSPRYMVPSVSPDRSPSASGVPSTEGNPP